MKGTRNIDEMAANARQLAYQENYSYTEGWNDNTLGYIFNLGLNQIYDKICQIDNVANIEEFRMTVFAGVQEYDIPQVVNLAIQIMDVRFLFGPQDWEFVTLQQSMIQDRYGYATNIPNTYCIRNGKIILSPTPNITRENSLIVNYQKRMRSLDYRRGKVSEDVISSYGSVASISNADPCVIVTDDPHGLTTGAKVGLGGVFEPFELIDQTFIITVTGANSFTIDVDTSISNAFSGTCIWYENPLKFQLNFTTTSQKDLNLQANAESILNKVDWCCIVDRNGESVVDAIPINNYNQTSFVLTCESNYVMPYASWLAFQGFLSDQEICFIVTGDYASTHSQLDRKSEDLLVEYAVLRLLRLQSAAEPTKDQLDAEEAVLERLAIAYRRYRPSIVPIIWQKQQRRSIGYMGGRGCY